MQTETLRRIDAVLLGDEYPKVHCELHQPPKPGYVVCVHVAHGADARIHFAPTMEELGHILCAQCLADGLSFSEERVRRAACSLEVYCADCVAYHLSTLLPACEVVAGATVQ